jgi:hypothetical protein
MFNAPTLRIMSELRRLFAENRVRSQVIPCGICEKVTLGQILLPLVGFATGIPLSSTRYGLAGPGIEIR